MKKWTALIAIFCCTSAHADATRSAPSEFVTGHYGLTFKVPHGAVYCPLPRDWVGSDHGTTIFLQKPRDCGRAGYPSSDREFSPLNAARIQLYYGYVTWDDADLPPKLPCRRVGSIRFLGGNRDVCEHREQGQIIREVEARYMSDNQAEAVLTLVTSPKRRNADMEAFQATAASMRTCTQKHDDPKGEFTMSAGDSCPTTAVYF